MGLRVERDKLVPDGHQVWMSGHLVLDITTSERAKFMAMFGLMRVPEKRATSVKLSPNDYDAMVLSLTHKDR